MGIRLKPSSKLIARDRNAIKKGGHAHRNGETILASTLVSMGFSYLVRLGLRDARDPRILDSIKVIDQLLKVDTPSGPLYHRYNDDGYGEHADGSAFDGSGIGRAWPLLVGERGHLAVMAGEPALPYLATMLNCASAGGLLPEQVWDSAPVPERALESGRPSGSAMPLLWAHPEFLKLLIASESGRPLELLKTVESHFRGPQGRRASAWHWRIEVPVTCLQKGVALVIEDRTPFSAHLGFDGWQHIEERTASLQPFGMWGVRLTGEELSPYCQLDFTRCHSGVWEGVDHRILLDQAPIKDRLKTVGAA